MGVGMWWWWWRQQQHPKHCGTDSHVPGNYNPSHNGSEYSDPNFNSANTNADYHHHSNNDNPNYQYQYQPHWEFNYGGDNSAIECGLPGHLKRCSHRQRCHTRDRHRPVAARKAPCGAGSSPGHTAAPARGFGFR